MQYPVNALGIEEVATLKTTPTLILLTTFACLGCCHTGPDEVIVSEVPPHLDAEPEAIEPPESYRPKFTSVRFEKNKAVLSGLAKAEVDNWVAELKAYPEYTATIVGHTDDSGDEEYNFRLGQRRAEAVAAHMIEQGIAPERIQTHSRGETDPTVPNAAENIRRLNRRVSLELHINPH